MVDVVVGLEGDPEFGLRFLRCSKNRFGSINEVGVFTMEERGLVPVADPSGALLDGRNSNVPGSVLFPTIDGLRSLTVEVQALVAATKNPQPRRSVKGLPAPRLHQVLAVLDRHAAIDLARHDVYVSVMGGLRLTEPAADLPVAIAVASSFTGVPVGGVAAFGEVGLTGELRSVSQAERRTSEAERLGARSIVSPAATGRLSHALAAAGIGGAPCKAPSLDIVG
jgi:DNA repair protein RadA/Sms